jgi:hypothetical protein
MKMQNGKKHATLNFYTEIHENLNTRIATLTNDCEIDFRVPGLGFPEIDSAPVDAGVGDLDIFKTKFGRCPLRYEVGAAAKHVFV